MVTFKPLKYKHRRRALTLIKDLDVDENGMPETNAVIQSEQDITALVMGLVEDWDFNDIETDEKIPIGEPDELSDEQYVEVMGAFSEIMNASQVPKANASPPSSGSKTSKKGRPQTARSGSKPRS